MLETLIAPRIRRTLLEHLVAHPVDRFYLRGLAKDLNLPISPLRRELKRLEGFGMLRAVREGNMLFYTVDTTAPVFQQLHRASGSVQAPPAAEAPSAVTPTFAASSLQPPAPGPVIPVGMISARPNAAAWPSALPLSLLISASVVGLALMVVVIGLVSFTAMNRNVRSALGQRAAITASTAKSPSASGIMRGSRLQILPGGFGGFSASGNSESR